MPKRTRTDSRWVCRNALREQLLKLRLGFLLNLFLNGQVGIHLPVASPAVHLRGFSDHFVGGIPLGGHHNHHLISLAGQARNPQGGAAELFAVRFVLLTAVSYYAGSFFNSFVKFLFIFGRLHKCRSPALAFLTNTINKNSRTCYVQLFWVIFIYTQDY